MKNLLLLIVVVLFNININAQPKSDIDSIKTYISQNQYKTAIDFINKKNHLEDKYLGYLAVSYKNIYNYPQAIKYYLLALKSDSSNCQLNIELANIYKQYGYNDKALIHYRKADKINPTVMIKAEMASLLVLSDLQKDALKIYTELYSQDTTNTFFIKNIARCYESLNDLDSTILYHNKVLAIDNFDPYSTIKLANLYIRKKDITKSLDLTINYIKKDSLNNPINRVNAYTYVLQKDYEKAVFQFEKCIRNNDTSLFISKYLGIAYFKIEKYDLAKDYLEKAYYQDSTDARNAYFLGLACSKSYYREKGIYYLNKTLSLMCPSDRELSDLYQNIAEAYRGFNKDNEALKFLLKSESINPTDSLLSYKIAELYDVSFKNKKMALKYYQNFISTRPQRKNEDKEKDRNSAITAYYNIVEKRIKVLQEELKRNN